MASGALKHLFKGGRADPKEPGVVPGAVFRKTRSDFVVETAKIVAVTRDPVGIPHVRFDVTFQGPAQLRLADGQRLLSLSSFREHFGVRGRA